MGQKKYKTEKERLEARRAAARKYSKSQKGKISARKRQAKYRQTEKGKLNIKKIYQKFISDDENRIRTAANRLKYQKTQKGFLARKRATKKYFKTDKGKEQRRKNFKKWHEKEYKNNPQYRARSIIHRNLLTALKRQSANKSDKTIKLLGLNFEAFKDYFEKLFRKGMNWENHGDWHIDHKVPCSKFDLTNPEQQKICFNYKNLQPLWAIENLKKSDKTDYIINDALI